MTVGILAVPVLLEGLGIERLGILAIAWLIVGYSGLLDLGLSRSITQITAKEIGTNTTPANRLVLWTAVLSAGALSIVASGLIWAAMPTIVTWLKVSPEVHAESVSALRVFTLSVPATVLASILIGFLTAYSRFGLINVIKIPTGTLMTGGPLLAVLFGSDSLFSVMVILTGARWITLGAFGWAVGQVEARVWFRPCFNFDRLRQLLSLGSWITMTNVISPLLVYCDRLFIGSVLSASAIAYYTTPQDAITKILVLPVAIVTVLFPAVARRYSTRPSECIEEAREVAVNVFVILFPLITVVALYSREAMTLWVGRTFADESHLLLKAFAVGVLINAIAQVPATTLQAIGRPRWPATLHLAEALLYIPGLYFAVVHFGLLGAAFAWVARILVDFIGLNWALRRVWPNAPALFRARDYLPPFVLVSTLIIFMILAPQQSRPGFIGALLTIFFAFYRNAIFSLVNSALARIRHP